MSDRGAVVKHGTYIFRRLHRIFAHAWFQHLGVFGQVEGQSGLYVLFKTVCDSYDLLPAENYKLPPEAEGLEPVEEPKAPTPSILKNTANNNLSVEDEFLSAGRTNTRRHIRQSPSVGSAVTTVLETDEEDAGDVTQKLSDLSITEEESEIEATEVPVIVETYEVNEEYEASGVKPEPEQTGNSEAQLSSPGEAETPIVEPLVEKNGEDAKKEEAPAEAEGNLVEKNEQPPSAAESKETTSEEGQDERSAEVKEEDESDV